MRCQTSSDYALYRYGNASKVFDLDYAGEGGFIHALSSKVLFWESDEESCINVGMSNLSGVKPAGSLGLLWPLFLSLCMGAFTDTLSSTLQGRAPRLDFNLLELSFAFNEAETMIVKLFETALTAGADDSSETIDRRLLINATNTTPDMLLIALIWAMSNLSSMVWNVFGKRHQYRLIDTGIWGIAYFAAISRSLIMMWKHIPENELFWSGRIPLILLMGFIPHFAVVAGTAACAFIYFAALIATACSLPPTVDAPATFRERLARAHSNLQANIHFSNSSPLSLKLTDDFYTALLNGGFTILSAASEAVYLNEGSRLMMNNTTWIERQRLMEIQQGLLYQKTRESMPAELRSDLDDRVEVAGNTPQPTGYSLERRIRGQRRDEMMAAIHNRTGMPEVEYRYSSRIWIATQFVLGTFWLSVGFMARMTILGFEACGILWRPQMLVRLMGLPKNNSSPQRPRRNPAQRRTDLLVFPDGDAAYIGRHTDVEAEFRKHSVAEHDIDEQMYGWWKQGGYMGDVDGSGDYAPSIHARDDDITSVISMSTNASSDEDNEWEDEQGSGRRTPTQRNPYPSSREATPFENDATMGHEQLASLLDPKTKTEKEEARILAHRLRHPGVLTRSQYRRAQAQDQAALLSSSRFGARFPDSTSMSPEEEEAALEQFIISRRAEVKPKPSDDDEAGAGPMCVVCQDSPRTILLWPCGCLCLCDECRVNMAVRNFATCICCRTNTVAYSRLYVP